MAIVFLQSLILPKSSLKKMTLVSVIPENIYFTPSPYTKPESFIEALARFQENRTFAPHPKTPKELLLEAIRHLKHKTCFKPDMRMDDELVRTCIRLAHQNDVCLPHLSDDVLASICSKPSVRF